MRYYYRYEESLYTESRLMLVLIKYPVIKDTEKGVWIDIYGRKRFVLNDARKKFASATEDEALQSFYARKRRQIKILKAQLKKAEKAAELTPKDGIAFLDWRLDD